MDYLEVPLQTTIPKTDEGKDKDKIITLYNIQIQIGNTSTTWQVRKRYSMFRELYSRVSNLTKRMTSQSIDWRSN